MCKNHVFHKIPYFRQLLNNDQVQDVNKGNHVKHISESDCEGWMQQKRSD